VREADIHENEPADAADIAENDSESSEKNENIHVKTSGVG
jgi:hypothetical protein